MKSSFGVLAKNVLRWMSSLSHERVSEIFDVVCFGVWMNFSPRPWTKQVW